MWHWRMRYWRKTHWRKTHCIIDLPAMPRCGQARLMCACVGACVWKQVRKLLARDVPSETHVTRQTSPSRTHTLAAARRSIADTRADARDTGDARDTASTDRILPASPATLALPSVDLGRKDDPVPRESGLEGLCALCGASAGERGLEDGKMLKDLLALARAQQAILKVYASLLCREEGREHDSAGG